MDLVIVESPNKCKKIKQILGGNYRVEASVGHVADLPKKAIGVDFTNFQPDYVATEQGKKVLANLKRAANDANTVYLATDPDREGEAIAAHLKHFLNLKKAKRITFNEITHQAITRAIAASRDIDTHLYQAQQARRVIDRLVGYQVSSKLYQLAKQNLSAGRVQSVALRLVVEREQAIKQFSPTNHFGVKLLLGNTLDSWVAKWDSREWVTEDAPYVLDKALVEQVLATERVTITSIDTQKRKKNPPPPFITTTLQKAANLTLGLSAAKTMSLAQELFAKGLITYHRTDNPNLSDETLPAIKSALLVMELAEHASQSKRGYKAQGSAQEAHEAIRPTDFMQAEVEDDDEQNQLYQLIRYRALASQMNPAEIETTEVVSQSAHDVNGRKLTFLAKTAKTVYPGWLSLIEGDQADENASVDEDVCILDTTGMAIGDEVKVKNAKLQELKTKAPARYTEPSLISKLEKDGIGRPATYASILSNITQRGYLVTKGRQYLPSESAEMIVNTLSGKFKFMELDYTKDMEAQLDAIAAGQGDYFAILSQANQDLTDNLAILDSKIPKYPCPVCSADLIRCKSKAGEYFWGCSRYQEGCKHTQPDEQGKPGERPAPTLSSTACPACDSPMRLIKGKNGPFLGCSNYKGGCKQTRPCNSKGVPIKLPKCPKCGSDLRKLKSNRGTFWGCSGHQNGCRETFADKNGKPQLQRQ